MDEGRERAIFHALKAVLAVAVNQGLALDVLCDNAIDSILNDPATPAFDVAQAVVAIDQAADALVFA